MRDLIVATLQPGEYRQVFMSDGTSPNLFSSGSFAVCRVAEPTAPYVIRMYRVSRTASGAWTAFCGFESKRTPNAGRPTSGEIERSPWEERPKASRQAEVVTLLSCDELTRWYQTLRRHGTPDHPVGKWDECEDPGEEYLASYRCMARFSSAVLETKATFDRLSHDVSACLGSLPDVSRVLEDEVLEGETDTSYGQSFAVQYGNQWEKVSFHIYLHEHREGSEIVITGANYSGDFDPRNMRR